MNTAIDRVDPRDGIAAGWLGREPQAFRRDFEALLKYKRVPAGQSLYASEDHGDALVGIGAGYLALQFPMVSGEEVVSHVCARGFWLGATMLAAAEPRRHLTATARTELTIAIVPLPVMRRALQDNPDWWASIARLMEVHWALTACIARDLMLRRHQDRVAATLLRLSGLRPAPPAPAPDLIVPVTHHEIATMANCSPSFVHAELRRLQDKGWVELG